MCYAALAATARFTPQSDSFRQRFGHPRLPAKTTGMKVSPPMSCWIVGGVRPVAAVTRLLQPAGNCRGVPLLDDGRVDVEIAVTDPGWPHAPVHEARPGLAGGAVRETVKIVGLHAGQLRFRGNLGNAFVLHGALVLPADNERDAGILYKVLMLARLGHGIEQKFPAVRDGDADHRRLGGALGSDTRLNRPGLGTHVGQQLCWREGVMMFAHGAIVPYFWAVNIWGKPWADGGRPCHLVSTRRADKPLPSRQGSCFEQGRNRSGLN